MAKNPRLRQAQAGRQTKEEKEKTKGLSGRERQAKSGELTKEERQKANTVRKNRGMPPVKTELQKGRERHGGTNTPEELYGKQTESVRKSQFNRRDKLNGKVESTKATDEILGVNRDPNQGKVKPAPRGFEADKARLEERQKADQAKRDQGEGFLSRAANKIRDDIAEGKGELVEVEGETAEERQQREIEAARARMEIAGQQNVKRNEDGSVTMSPEEYERLMASPPSTDQGPSMEEQQGTGQPTEPTMEEAQRQQVDPDAERRNREIAQLYNDTGLQEPTMEEAQAPQEEEQISMQDAQAPPEFTGYTEETAAAAFVNPETGVDQTGVDTGSDQTPEQTKDSLLSEIQNNLIDVVNKAGFDPDEYRASQQSVLEQRYARAQEALARRFYLQPGGAMSGDAQLAFETLAAEHNEDLAALDKDITDREKEAINTQLDAYNNIFQTAATDDRERLKITQNSEQFAESMRLELKKFGLTEEQTMAAIDKIFSDIKNNDERTALEVGTTWADVLGFTGTESGQLGAEDLGIELTEDDMMSAFLPTGGEETKQKIRDLVVARTGQEPSDAEVQIIMSGQKANFNNIPTLESRRLSQENSQQNMERAAKYGSIADGLGLDRDKFNQSVKEYDNKWALSIGDTASLNGLDENAFTAARYKYDNYANEIFFNESLSPAEKSAALAAKTNEIAAEFGDQADAFIRANTQFEQTIGAQQQATARQLGISSEQYKQAQGQIDRNERKMEATWASLIAGADTYDYPLDAGMMNPVRVSAFRDMGNLINEAIDAGTLDVGDGQGASVAQQFLQNADDETLDRLRNSFMVSSDGNAIFTDIQMEQNLGVILDNVFTSGVDDSGRFNVDDVQEGMELGDDLKLTASPSDWWSSLSKDQLNAWMSLLGSGSFQASPERQGVNWMGVLGRVGGAGLGFALTGGTAAGAAAGFNYMGQLADAGGR